MDSTEELIREIAESDLKFSTRRHLYKMVEAMERLRVACAAHDSWNACVCDACVALGANPSAIKRAAK